MRKWLGGVVLALVLAGCSGQPSPPAGDAPVTTGNSQAAQPAGKPVVAALPASPPVQIDIPKLKAKSSLIPLGLNADETIEVPPITQPMQAGWYTKAPTPGEVGPAVVLGHVDGNHQPGIFFRLKEMAAGDEVLVSRQDGSTVRFVVDRVEQVSKSEFPTDAVYGDTTRPELRLITCGGEFDHGRRSYKDNIVVFATFTPAA